MTNILLHKNFQEGSWSFGNDLARNVVILVWIIVHNFILIIEEITF